MKQSDLRVGSKVRYQPAHYGEERWENGIVKEIPSHTTKGVRVVYNCNNEWNRYQDYTSAMTCLEDLRMGWQGEDEFSPDCGCRFENDYSNAIILCEECSKLPCHNQGFDDGSK